MLGPVLSGQRPVEPIGATTPTSSPSLPPSPTPAPTTSPTAPAASASPSPSAPPPSPSSSASPGPTIVPASPEASPIPSPGVPSAAPGPAATAVPVRPGPTPIPADLQLSFWTKVRLQSRLDILRERYAIPGISVAIVMPDGSSWRGVSGLADVEAKRPVTPSTGFAIASVSKTFTSALILSLAEEGRINLDAPVRVYLPKLKKVGAKVTVRQLLNHTSGLRDYFFHASIDHALLSDPDRRWNATEALRYVGKAYFKPGTGWHYSNTNYLVLGLLAEAVGHRPLGAQIRARFLKPLALDGTWYQPTEKAHGHCARLPVRVGGQGCNGDRPHRG
jgi:CubicO group peptidase (beta-lactamase class C family)